MRRLQLQQALRLSSFSSNSMVEFTLLSALPAHSLTQLHLDLSCIGAATKSETSVISAAVAQLSGLQELHLEARITRFPGCVLPSLAQLSQLTSLRLVGNWQKWEQPLQQLLGQPLPLRQLQLELCHDLPALDMSALGQLQQLTVVQMLPKGTVLPEQLRQIQLGNIRSPPFGTLQSAAELSALHSLKQLQRLELVVGTEDSEVLINLAQLSAVQDLALHYRATSTAAVTASVWLQLPQLQELTVDDRTFSFGANMPNQQRLSAILAGVAAATGLTKLQLQAWAFAATEPGEAGLMPELPFKPVAVAVCPSLTGLTRLKDVCISYGAPAMAAEAEALTALTALTRVVLGGTFKITAAPF
jgi:hypothetical protein